MCVASLWSGRLDPIRGGRRLSSETKELVRRIKTLGEAGLPMSAEDARRLIRALSRFTTQHLQAAGYPATKVRAVTTKLRDAGRRSPPWRPTSSRLPGRPQDGSDGNRRSRWLFSRNHKYYADEVTATLVEVRYYLQVLSMKNAPPLPRGAFQTDFLWLTSHPVLPGYYKDPIQRIDIDLDEVMASARTCQSGHLIPLDRGGRHEPANAFLMHARSNQLQGNLTLDELLDLMRGILQRHER